MTTTRVLIELSGQLKTHVLRLPMNVFWWLCDATVAILLAWAPYISSLSPPSEYLMFACPFSYPHITILESMKLLFKTTKEEVGKN